MERRDLKPVVISRRAAEVIALDARRTKRLARRMRGARCLTGQVEFYLIAGRLIRSWGARTGKMRPCTSRVEKGQDYCVHCRRINEYIAIHGRI